MAGSGISSRSTAAIRRLDAGEEGYPSSSVRRLEPISSAPTQYVTQGVVPMASMTQAQRAQLQALMDRRPDAVAFRTVNRPK